MRSASRIRFVVFVVCLLAAMPSARGAGGDARLDGVKAAELTVPLDVSPRRTVTMCHRPPEDPCSAQTIAVPLWQVPIHLSHGDSLGECPQSCAGVPSAVPKTGQVTCSDTYGTPIDCAGTGQDGQFQTGISVDPRFTDNENGTVSDNLTGLVWLKNANCFGGQVWPDALALSKSLASGDCGLTDGSVAGDWRLPNIKELESLIDVGHVFPALPGGHPFSGVQFDWYWSSSTNVFFPSHAWIVHLPYGYAVDELKVGFYFSVWPVRGGQ